MRVLRTIAVSAVLLLCIAALSWAALPTNEQSEPVAAVNPGTVDIPEVPPTRNQTTAEAYSFVSSAEIAASLRVDAASGSAADPQPESSGATAGAVVNVEATVLSVRTIVVDVAGDVLQVTSNTRDPRATMSLYIVRRDADDGDAQAMTPTIWAQARTLLQSSSITRGVIRP